MLTKTQLKLKRQVYHRQWYLKNRAKKLQQNKDWRKNNPDKTKLLARKGYYKNRTKNLQRMKKWGQENPYKKYLSCLRWRKASQTNTDKCNASSNRSYHKHREKRIKYQCEYIRKRLKTDVSFALTRRLRMRMRDALRRANITKSGSTIELLGCSAIYYKQYLESLFLPGMSWANRGLWHIDHIKPISSFDLTTSNGQQMAFHYTNCQPLWALDNQRKGAKIL